MINFIKLVYLSSVISLKLHLLTDYLLTVI